MSDPIIVVSRKSDFPWPENGYRIMTAREYATTSDMALQKSARVINLCTSYEYLSLGYYCSLLAEARGQRVIPSAETILDLNWRRINKQAMPELTQFANAALRHAGEDETAIRLLVYFGQADDRRLERLARRAYDLFRCPILSIHIRRQSEWGVERIEALSLRDLSEGALEAFETALARYARTRWRAPKAKSHPNFHLAILCNPDEALAPSDPRALAKFVEAAASFGIGAELITRKDYARLPEYDALFIRETTRLDHHTYRFAKRAAAEGMPVIDDPVSIQRCTNKVYLAELLRINRVPTPATVLVDRARLEAIETGMGFPVVLKIPDGAFSRGILKADTPEEFVQSAEKLLRDSDLILVQEYLYTEFDWRIGVLEGEALYACQYFMSRGHWQIIRHAEDGRISQGAWRALSLDAVPPAVIDAALKAAGLIGNGLYGVDIKDAGGRISVIEVNDNPSIEAGVEDGVLKDEIYRRIMGVFRNRLEARQNSVR